MGKQIMLANLHDDETRIALTEGGVLVGLHVQQTDRERKVGNVYRGTVVKVNPAFQAAFVDYGEARNGFLSISDVNYNLFKPGDGEKGRPKIQHLLREGQQVMVQVLKEGMNNKGAALTTFISVAGRYLVLSPDSDRSGVSRKIEDQDARQRLKEVMEALSGGDNLGIIIRTAGIDRPIAELKRDLEALRREWKATVAKSDKMKKPGLLHQEPSTIVRVLRDYFTTEVQEVWVDDAEGYQEALRYFKSTLPKYQKRLKLYVGDKSLFSAHRIEAQIEALDSSRVPLKSGGSLVIESTEALVSVDVNSGRSNQATDIEETALRTNLEATEEIARQLRLRNLGGLIVGDFIDMTQAKNRKQVEKAMKDALKGDKARTTVGTISQFGMLELSRQRIDMELSRGLRIQCPNCGGTGHIPTVKSSANNVLRNIRDLAASGQYAEIHGELPLASANYLLNEKREALRDLELEFEVVLKLDANPNLPAGHPIMLHGGKAGAPDEAPPEDLPEAAVAEASEEGGDEETPKRRRRRRGRRGRRDDATVPFEQAAAEETPGGEEGDEIPPDLTEEELEIPDAGSDEGDALAALPAGAAIHEGEPATVRAEPVRTAVRPTKGQPHRVQAAAGNGSGARLEYRSEHIITDPEAVEKLPPRIVRSNAFKAVVDTASPNTVLFDSSQLGVAGPQAGGQPAGSAGPVPRKRSPGKAAGKGAGKGKPAKRAPADRADDSPLGADTAADSTTEEHPTQAGAPQAKAAPSGTRSRRGRSSGGRARTRRPGARGEPAAPQAG